MCSVAHKTKNDTNSTDDVDDVTKISDDTGASALLRTLSAEDEKRLKVLQLELDMWQSTGIRVPDHMTDEMWTKVLFECLTVHSRMKTYKYWFKKEKAAENQRRKKAERQKIHAERVDKLKQQQTEGKWSLKNTYMLFARESVINMHYFNNLAYAMMHGQTLVFDFGFEDHMTDRELKELADQLTLCHGTNKLRMEPFHFHFCNLNPNGRFGQRLSKTFPAYNQLPMSVSSEDYLDLYPHDKLVYLSPNSKSILEKFDHNDIYIVGGIVDKATEVPLTMARAKNNRIRTAKFPLDHYLKWLQGSRALTVNQVVSILLELKDSNDWRKAFAHIPKRKATWVGPE
ncbi:RNA (guanine-9-)-methyltransferase domain-containing protein 1 [Lamellibrachia satsuma]|nr:RNA (guanine-9-)-methyltransferase domain-containing protein 1 [Lamellibrachia satsuma]